MTVNFTTLFTQLGKGIRVLEVINQARGTDVPAEVEDFQDEFSSATVEMRAQITAAETARTGFISGSASAVTNMQTAMQNVVIETVDVDSPLPTKSLTEALAELVTQMRDNSESVDASAVSASASAITGNGDGVLVVSAKRGDGLNQENMLAETITLKCSDDTTPGTATFIASSSVAAASKLDADYPAGSGLSGTTITAIDAASTLLGNGDFDDEDDIPNVPDEWHLSVGTIGTTIKMTDYEVQTLTVTGTPTTGTYQLSWSNPDSDVLVTTPLAFDANAATVQSALRAIPGLESVTVAATGTSPNYTHTITFIGVAGNISELTVVNNTTDSGTYTPGTSTAGSANAYKGRAVEYDSDGAELTTINRKVTLVPLTQYAFNVYMLADVGPAAGVITVDLVDGIGGTVINDEQGVANSFTIDCTALTTSFVAKNGVFRMPRVLPTAVYLRIRVSTAISGGTSVFFDHAALAAMTSLYTGGPAAAVFSGKLPFTKGSAQIAPDKFTITVTNDRAGEFQEWFERLFAMAAKGLILPSDSGGAETIDDALIA